MKKSDDRMRIYSEFNEAGVFGTGCLLSDIINATIPFRERGLNYAFVMTQEEYCYVASGGASDSTTKSAHKSSSCTYGTLLEKPILIDNSINFRVVRC